MNREEQLRIVRDSVRTEDVECNPATFDPPEWALRAVQRAYTVGHHAGCLQSDMEARVMGGATPGPDDRAELRAALGQLLDQFGDHLDKHVRREFSALVSPGRRGDPP